MVDDSVDAAGGVIFSLRPWYRRRTEYREESMVERCQFWLPKKKRFCSNSRFNGSSFCGNHSQRSDCKWVPCPVDPSHSVLEENLEGHIKRCPVVKRASSLSVQPYYQKGINCGSDEGSEDDGVVSSEMKRNGVYAIKVVELIQLLRKIQAIHGLICGDLKDSYKISEACNFWVNNRVDRKLPYQGKHVLQQASILGNLEDFGVLRKDSAAQNDAVSAVVEFGAGRGYLTQVLADCYGIYKAFLVERKSYKLKADRSLRQKESLVLERLRIDIEDLNLSAVESLTGIHYLAIGKHLCGPATDLTLRCCIDEHYVGNSGVEHSSSPRLRGLAIAPCCHHLCQWKHYINKPYLLKQQISREDFHAMTWFTSWAVDADHASGLTDVNLCDFRLLDLEKLHEDCIDESAEEFLKKVDPIERAMIGFMCKDIIDMGRFIWVKEHGLASEMVNYVSRTISPENHLIIARGNKDKGPL